MNSHPTPSTMFDGAAYEKRHGQWSRAVGHEFVKWLAQPHGQRWLDVGCGTGAATEMVLAEAAPSAVAGIDASESQIA